MKKILEMISDEMKNAFEQAGYDRELGKVTLSNRPDLCEYQCNGAMAGAKQYKKAPIMIANDVAAKLTDSNIFARAEAVAPGFLNLTLKNAFVGAYVKDMRMEEKYGLEETKNPAKIVIDYGAKCSKAAACRASALCDYRRERQAHCKVCGASCNRRHSSGGLGAADGADYERIENQEAGTCVF